MKFYCILTTLLLFLMSCKDDRELSIIDGNYDVEFSEKDNLKLKLSLKLKSDTLLNEWLDNNVLDIEPKIDGAINWNNPDEIYFHPNSEYLPETVYKVSLNKDIIHLFDSVSNVSNNKIKFKTKEFKIDDVFFQWQISNKNVNKDILGVRLNFSYKVNPVEISNNIEFEIDGVILKHQIVNTEVSKDIRFELYIDDAKKNSDKELKIKIKDGITVYNSEWKSKKKINEKYKIPSIDDLKVTSSNISISENKSYIKLYLNQSIDKEKFSDSLIRISPAIKFKTEVSDYGINIYADFESGKTYELTLLKDIVSIYGRNLDVSYSSMFTFAKIEPNISFTSKDMIYLSKNGSKKIGVNAVGLDSIKVNIVKIYENNLLEFFRNGRTYDYEYIDDDYISFYRYRTQNYGDVVYEEIIDLKKMQNNGIVKYTDFRFKDKIKKNVF